MTPGTKVWVCGEIFQAPPGAPVTLVIFKGAAGVPTAPVPIQNEDVVPVAPPV